MYITIAGIKRSGTTWQANLVRILCEEHGLRPWMGEHYSLNEKEDFDVTINKIHPYVSEIAERSDFVFISWRELREIKASWERFSGNVLKPNEEETWLQWSMLWALHANYMMPFAAIERAPEVVVADINRILFQEEIDTLLSAKVMGRMEREVVPPTEVEYDPVTCLFRDHITTKKSNMRLL